MVNAIRNRANASSSRATHPSISLSVESHSQGSLSPLDQEDTVPQTPDSNISSINKQNVRGNTRGIALRKLNKQNKQKLVVHIDAKHGRPLDSVESAKLSSELGILSRESMRVPAKWKDFEKSELSVAFDQLGMHLSIDNPEEETKENVLELLKHRIRHQRHRLNKHFGKFTSLEEAIRNKPYFGGLTQANWELLCTNLFSDPQYQERCKINRNNRKKMITNHNQGSRSFVAARHILSKELEEEEEEEDDDDDGDEEVDRIKFYKHCHYKEGKGWATPQCEKNYVEMERRRTEVEESGEKVDADKIADDVLGKRSSYIVGLGYGPKPKKIASNSTMKMLEERLKEKEKANLELKDRVVSMETTLQEYGRLIQQLMESQQRSSTSPW